MKGLYVLDGHAIAAGTKKAIATPGPRDIVGERVLILKHNKTESEPARFEQAGTVRIGTAQIVDIPTFDALVPEHGVSVGNRKSWWPTNEKFYLYPVLAVKLWDTPLPLDLQPGIPMSVRLDPPIRAVILGCEKCVDGGYSYSWAVCDE